MGIFNHYLPLVLLALYAAVGCFFRGEAQTTAGVTIAETDGSTSVSEDGGVPKSNTHQPTDTYTVVLKTEPTHGVTVTATASTGVQVAGPGGTAGGTATLTFTTTNWNTAQTVTVTGVKDNTDNPGGVREVSISHAASSTDPNYTIGSAGIVEVRVTDNDATVVRQFLTAGDIYEGETKEFLISVGRGLVDGESLRMALRFRGDATRGTDYTVTGAVANGVEYNNLNSGGATVVFTGPESGATATRARITLSATADSTVENNPENVRIFVYSVHPNILVSTYGGVGLSVPNVRETLGNLAVPCGRG